MIRAGIYLCAQHTAHMKASYVYNLEVESLFKNRVYFQMRRVYVGKSNLPLSEISLVYPNPQLQIIDL